MLSFSIVINTLNRGPSLQKTLESLRWLRYEGEFEVIVVNGPSTDDSDAVIQSWLPKIRAGRCPMANLSMSRNIGICMAQGDVVAFIDDDAIPEPEWLTQLAAAYDDPEVGGAGGLVFDQSGYTYQYEYSTANRLGNANWAAGGSASHLCFPASFEFPYLQGTNASFRRSALLEVGGFDEEIEYYLDETELCCRLVDAGYVIRQLPNAYVHHKFAPSHVRDDHKITRYRYPVIKNKIYFSLKHGRPYRDLADILEDNRRFSEGHRGDVEFHIAGGRLPESELEKFREENERAWEVGLARGMDTHRELITPEKLAAGRGDFHRFTPIHNADRKAIVLVSQDFPPNHSGGIATFSRDLAQALGAQGHIVHVITRSTDINRVDFEQGVWVHRMVQQCTERSPGAISLAVPQHIWDWSATALQEVRRIATHREVAVVEAPIWDCEGVAFLLDGEWPLVTSLHTTLHFWIESHPEMAEDAEWMRTFGQPMLALERQMMTAVQGVRANSRAIVQRIEEAYGFAFDPERLRIIPHGMGPAAVPAGTRVNKADAVQILYVGRLEPRKGIDVLLEALPELMHAAPEAIVRIVGDATEVGHVDYRKAFAERYAGTSWFGNVRFEGRLSDPELDMAYADCDIFVAPSRFESFGLVYLEAMRQGKPVVGTTAGGIPEVVQDGVTGLLTEPGDPVSLAKALSRLAQDAGLRESMGEAGRRHFEQRFTADRMARESHGLYALSRAGWEETVA